MQRLAVLIDLGGTLHVEGCAIPGSVAALQRLRMLRGVALRFVTNTTRESHRMVEERLQSMGFSIRSEEIFTSLSAARRLVEDRKLRPLLLLEQGTMEDFAGE